MAAGRSGWIRGLYMLSAFVFGLATAMAGHTAAAAPAASMAVTIDGRRAHTITPGARIAVVVHGLPAAARPYCLGLTSVVDRYALPVSLGSIARDAQGVGRLMATIPPRLFPAEPAGPYLLLVGACTPIAPDGPFIARATIRIIPAPSPHL